MQAWASWIRERLEERNQASQRFFPQQAEPLARACQAMALRFLAGGRLLAFGRGVYATDAQHVAVEFVHPVIVGKRALPALDLSPAFPRGVVTLVQPADIVMGFGPPEGDALVHDVLASARARGAQTFALPGRAGADDGPDDYAAALPNPDPFVQQELFEVLYHTLWETVHVFFEHRELGQQGEESGAASFLYPFLGSARQDTTAVVKEVARSIENKAQTLERLRSEVAQQETAQIVRAIETVAAQLQKGGKLILLGNGGSATDANDWALDMLLPPPGMAARPAVSLAAEPAVLSALANDVGAEVLFLRQLIAHAHPHDVVVAISTSGGSKNILMALAEAKKRGLTSLALLGYDGGEVVRSGLADVPIVIRSDYIPRIQEAQASVYHIIRQGLERALGA